jgi:hypothetical protein
LPVICGHGEKSIHKKQTILTRKRGDDILLKNYSCVAVVGQQRIFLMLQNALYFLQIDSLGASFISPQNEVKHIKLRRSRNGLEKKNGIV